MATLALAGASVGEFDGLRKRQNATISPGLRTTHTISSYADSSLGTTTILLGGTLSLGADSTWHSKSWHMHNALLLFVDWVNFVKGGVRLSATDRRMIEILSADDVSEPDNVRSLYSALVAGRIGGRAPDFLLGPYSSALTAIAADVADRNGALLMATAASTTSIFENRNLTFGMSNPADTYLHASVTMLHRLGVKSVSFIFEDAPATKDWCKGAATKAQALNLTVAARIQISQTLNATEISSALETLTTASADAVIGCTQNLDVCVNFVQQAAANSKLKFYTKALLLTACVTDPRFSEQLSSLAWHVMGTSPWSELDSIPDDMAGWSPADFARRYQSAFGQIPPYQSAAAFAGASLLVNAIETVGSLDPKLVASELTRTRIRTVYGDTVFDQNRQILLSFVTLQHSPPGNLSVVTAATALFPMPSWAERECGFVKRCETGGCRSDGTCKITKCEVGTVAFVNSAGQYDCRPCNAGSYSAGGTASACTICSPGRHATLEC